MQKSSILRAETTNETLKTRPWGGQRLTQFRAANGQQTPAAPIGESWEFSTLAGSESRSEGQNLSKLLGHDLPFLAKLIDTKTALSLQVHPDDDTGSKSGGKEEAWIVLDADEEAFVYAGVREEITTGQFEEQLRATLEDTAQESALMDMMQKIPVKRGSIVFVPARTVHAISGGIFLAEIQQPSDTTYRLYDYGSDRELHTDKAIETMDIHSHAKVWNPGEDPSPMTIAGKHVRITPLTEGRYELPELSCERLIVGVEGECKLKIGELDDEVSNTDLRLTTGGPLRIEVQDGGLIVVGYVV